MPLLRRRRSRSRTLQTVALLWSIWRWLPRSEKRRAVLLARRLGPWIVYTAVRRSRRVRRLRRR